MPVAIAGMHRSGSSLIARLLNLCGLDLGPTDQLMPPAPDNTEGFWESLPFVHVNEEILGQLGGRWDRPSQPLPGWEAESCLDPWREMGRGLPDQLGLKEPWGWKDPRNSLTLPFWNDLWPHLRVVACVRNPLEVANSLLLRDRFTFGKSLKLWLEYYRRLLSSASAEFIVVTHYEAFFVDPVAELTRLVEFLRLSADRERIVAACDAVATGLRHSQMGTGDLTEAGTTEELQQLYRRLIGDGGPVIAGGPADPKRRTSYTNTVRLALEFEESLETQQSHIRELEWQLRCTEIDRDVVELRAAEYAVRVRILEERLTARRHRYADRMAGLLFKVTEQ